MTTIFEITQNTGLIAVSGGSFQTPTIIRANDVRGGCFTADDHVAMVGEHHPHFQPCLARALVERRGGIKLPAKARFRRSEQDTETFSKDLPPEGWRVDLRALDSQKTVCIHHGTGEECLWLRGDGNIVPDWDENRLDVMDEESNFYHEYVALALALPPPAESTSGAAVGGAGWKAPDYPAGAPAATPGTYNPSPAQQLVIAAARQLHADGRFIIANLPAHKLDQEKRGNPERWRAMAQSSLDMMAKQMTVVITGENELPEPSAAAIKIVEEIRAASEKAQQTGGGE